jgi:hypothetical protein
MIRETEDYLDNHLGKREVPWPRRYEPGERDRGNGEILGPAKPPAMAVDRPG